MSYREGLVELPVRTALKGKDRAVQGPDELVGAVEALAVEDTSAGELPDALAAGEEDELRELRAVLFANVAACLIKLVRSALSSYTVPR